MKVAVIGAGMAGLAAARTLTKADNQVIVYEADDKPGGRVVTERIDGFTFDSGATSIAPFGHALEKVLLEELPTTDLIKIEKPISSHDGIRVVSGGFLGSKAARYCYRQGLDEIGKLLAQNLDVRYQSLVERIESNNDSYVVLDETFDAVILTPPIPVIEKILSKGRETRRFSNVRFRSCLSVLLGYDFDFDYPYHALVGPDQTVPLAWLSFESVKSPGRAPEGCCALVAQLSAEYSKRRYEAEDSRVIGETLGDITRLLGGKFASPKISQVVRFRQSHPETTTAFESVNSPMSRLLIAGDGLIGGRTELAYDSGIRAAKLLIENS